MSFVPLQPPGGEITPRLLLLLAAARYCWELLALVPIVWEGMQRVEDFVMGMGTVCFAIGFELVTRIRGTWR